MLTRRAHAQFWLAHDLLTRLPAVHAAMDAGALDEPRARVLSEWTTELDPEQARALCDELLPQARGLTTGQLIEQIKKLAIAVDPEWARRRYEQAVADRKVVGYRNADGSANLSGCNLPVDRVAAASGYIDTDADIINQLLAAAHLHESDDKGGYHNGDDTSGANRNDGDEDSSAAPTDQPTPLPRTEPGWSCGCGCPPCSGTTSAPPSSPAGEPFTPNWPGIAAILGGAEWRFAITDEHGQLTHCGITRVRPIASPTRRAGCPAIVELQVPATTLRALNARAGFLRLSSCAGWGLSAFSRRRYCCDHPAAGPVTGPRSAQIGSSCLATATANRVCDGRWLNRRCSPAWVDARMVRCQA